MRYLMSSSLGSKIFPQNLEGLTSALKEACRLSTQINTPVTLSIHEPGRTVKFRVFQDGATVWLAEPDDN
jgi:hypothetical protein